MGRACGSWFAPCCGRHRCAGAKGIVRIGFSAAGNAIIPRQDRCLACGAAWKSIDVSHGDGCPNHLLDEAMETPLGVLVHRCLRLLNAKTMGVTITLADLTQSQREREH